MSLELIEKGIESCRNGAFEEGILYFNRALAKDSDSIEALYNRGRALSKVGDLKESLNDFKRLVKLQPLNASFIGDYAVSLHLNNDNDEAAKAFEKALALEPENPYRYSSRAFFKDRIGDLEGAIEDYEMAVKLDPEDAIALNNKGLVEEKLGYKDKSKESFDKSNQIVGYQPDRQEVPPPEEKAIEKDEKPVTRSQVIKSVFTKDGFKDFARFSIDLLSGKAKKK